MSAPRIIVYDQPASYRVVRRGWKDPLDASYSQRRTDNRWNTPEFPVLYCCCSERVARAVALDVFGSAGVLWEDLQPAFRPQLAEIRWAGAPIDVATEAGVAAAGFAAEYPEGVNKRQTRGAATAWHDANADGVVCRSASLSRIGFSNWTGPFHLWSELPIFVRNSARPPELLQRREDQVWLSTR